MLTARKKDLPSPLSPLIIPYYTYVLYHNPHHSQKPQYPSLSLIIPHHTRIITLLKIPNTPHSALIPHFPSSLQHNHQSQHSSFSFPLTQDGRRVRDWLPYRRFLCLGRNARDDWIGICRWRRRLRRRFRRRRRPQRRVLGAHVVVDSTPISSISGKSHRVIDGCWDGRD